MVRMIISTITFAVLAMAAPNPMPQLSPDPSGEANVGNGQGLQFITGGCLADADCASGCCAGTGAGDAVCSAVAVSTAQGKQGCGFGGAAGESNATEPAGSPAQAGDDAAAVDSSAAGSENVGTGNGQQFITGQCLSDADCASGCCAGKEGSDTAACSAVLVANENGKTGCGFGA